MRSSATAAIGLALVLALTNGQAHAQFVAQDPDWKESELPSPPPAVSTAQLIPVDLPAYMTVRLGVDAQSIRLTPEGIIRYVMVATTDAAVTSATYEGVRCNTSEFKLYARYTASGKWVSVADAEWEALRNNSRARFAHALARQGLCSGRAASASTAAGIVYRLKNPPREAP